MTQPLPIRLILARFPAGHQTWPASGRGSQAASGIYHKRFNSKLKSFLCPVDFITGHMSFTRRLFNKYRPIYSRESSCNHAARHSAGLVHLSFIIRKTFVRCPENGPVIAKTSYDIRPISIRCLVYSASLFPK